MYLQGIYMKNQILTTRTVKALFCMLLSSLFFLTVNPIFADTTMVTNEESIQQSVHLNKSTIDDLVTLKGIGHKKAQAILAYRQKVGGFTSVGELINVKGIGEKVLLDNKNRLKI